MKATMCLFFVVVVASLALAEGLQEYGSVPEDALVLQLGVEGAGYETLMPGTQGGSLHVAELLGPSKWNPITASDGGTLSYTSHVFRKLRSLHPITNVLQPELAKSWEVSEDGLKITFHLRKGIRWSDGVPFTADDVLFTYNDLILNEDVVSIYRDDLLLPDGTYPRLEKTDSHTVVVKLSTPFRPILAALSSAIVPMHKLSQEVHKLNPQVAPGHFNEVWLLDTDVSEIVGLGPFVIQDFEPDRYVMLRRNPFYYAFDQNGTQLPYIDELIFQIVADRDVRLLRFLNGESHLMECRPSDVPVLKEQEEARGFSVSVGGWSTGHLFMTVNLDTEDENLRSLFRNIKFRQAVAHAMDRDFTIQGLYHGLGDPQWSPITMASPFYAGREYYGGPITERDAVIYEYDRARASELLDECGILDLDGDGMREFEDGTTVEIELITMAGRGETNAAQTAYDMKNVGLELHVLLLDFNTLVMRLGQGDYELLGIGMTGGVEPHLYASTYTSTGPYHFWHYSAREGDIFPYEERIDELFRLGASTYDEAKAFEYYKEFQILFATEDLGMIFGPTEREVIAAYDVVGNTDAVRMKLAAATGLYLVYFR